MEVYLGKQSYGIALLSALENPDVLPGPIFSSLTEDLQINVSDPQAVESAIAMLEAQLDIYAAQFPDNEEMKHKLVALKAKIRGAILGLAESRRGPQVDSR